MDNLDLTGTSFQNVTFGDIEFALCDFDEHSRFVECRFQKRLFVENCKNFGRVGCEKCFLTAQAKSMFQKYAVEGVDKRITHEQIADAIGYILKKFHRGVGLKTCKERGIRGSVRNEYRFGGEVLDTLVSTGVLEKFEARNVPMLRILAKADVFQLENNNFKRGP